MTYGDIKASLQTIKCLYESRDIFVNDNYNESSRHYPNVLLHISGRISCNSGTSRPSIGRHEETWWYSRHKYSGKILIPEMLWQRNLYAYLAVETLFKNVAYRSWCKGIETLLEICGTWLTDLWSSLVSQTNYIPHMFKAKQYLFSIFYREINTRKTHSHYVKTVIYIVKFYR